ncbi:hypothetical protein KBC79_03915 [Candidatus Woesebacteria bacterium]|nr:hypothetical protein [Candidatus Woesebacteria bacterium]
MQDSSSAPTPEEAAAQAMSQTSTSAQTQVSASSDDEVAASDELAQTLGYLQGVIERNAEQLTRLQDELKEKRDSLKSVYENDTTLATVEEEAQAVANKVKEKKAQIKSSAQVVTLHSQIGELNEQKKEIEETLSNHLLNYYQLTNSTSFDTSDGDQWEFNIRAKVKPRKGKGE